MGEIKELVVVQVAMSAFALFVSGIVYGVTGSWGNGAVAAIAAAGASIVAGFVLTDKAFASFATTVFAVLMVYVYVVAASAAATSTAVILAIVVLLVSFSLACGLMYRSDIGSLHPPGLVLIQTAVIYGPISYFAPGVSRVQTVVFTLVFILVGGLFLSDLATKKAGRAKLDS